MAHVLVTGRDGHLGKQLTPRLIKAGHTVRVMSRKAAPQNLSGTEWATAHLDTGEGLDQAVRGIDLIIHAASNAFNVKGVDIGGTKKLLDAAKSAGVGHVTYVSIVGIDRLPMGNFGYYQAKVAAEKLVAASGIPYASVRITQFYSFVERFFIAGPAKFPIAFLPFDFKFQAIDTGEAADAVVRLGMGGKTGVLPDVAGPAVMTIRQMSKLWFEAKGIKRIRLPMLTTGAFAAGLKLGQNTSPDHAVGKIAWAGWLAEKYGKKVTTQESMVSA